MSRNRAVDAARRFSGDTFFARSAGCTRDRALPARCRASAERRDRLAAQGVAAFPTGTYEQLAHCLHIGLQPDRPNPVCAMTEFLPDYLIRQQAAVGALVVFGVLRVIGAAVACERGWRISNVERCFIAAAVLYCVPQLFDLILQSYGLRAAAAELEGKAAGCAIALFCAPILSHRLGYE
jgi:hypothetical protein